MRSLPLSPPLLARNLLTNITENPAFLPPQMQQFPHNPQRPGPGPGPGPGGPQMFYPNQMPPMPHQTPCKSLSPLFFLRPGVFSLFSSSFPYARPIKADQSGVYLVQQHPVPFSGPSPAQPQFQHQHQHQHSHPHQQAPPPPPVQMSPAHSGPGGPGGVVQGGPQQNGQTQG